MDPDFDSGFDSGFTLGGLFIGFILLVFACVGIAAIVATALRRHRHSALLAGGVRDTATVVDNRVTSHSGTDNSSGYLSFQAVVVLDHQDGAEPVLLPDDARSSYVVGTKLDVVYDPADPKRVESINRPSIAGYVIGPLLVIVAVLGGVFTLSMLSTDL
jgi:hypothetical protein